MDTKEKIPKEKEKDRYRKIFNSEIKISENDSFINDFINPEEEIEKSEGMEDLKKESKKGKDLIFNKKIVKKYNFGGVGKKIINYSLKFELRGEKNK